MCDDQQNNPKRKGPASANIPDLLAGGRVKRYSVDDVSEEARHFDIGPDQEEKIEERQDQELTESGTVRLNSNDIRAGARIQRINTSSVAEQEEQFATGPDQVA